MAEQQTNWEAGSNGNALSGANTTNGSSFVVSGSSTSQVISTAQFAHGSRSALFTSSTASGTNYVTFAIGTTTAFAIRCYVYWTALPSGDTGIIWVGSGSSQRGHVEVTSAGAIRFRDDASGAQWNGTVTTSVGTMTTGTWYRIEWRMNFDGTARLAVYSLDSTSPLSNLDSGARTGINFGADSIDTLRLGGKVSTGDKSSTFYMDSVAYDIAPASLTFLGPYTEVLGTPVVALGTTTHPSTVGGSDGSQVVTWGAVTDASSYDALIAEEATPDQGDFVLVAAGVTSPYTFTGLEAGTYAYGIQAKA